MADVDSNSNSNLDTKQLLISRINTITQQISDMVHPTSRKIADWKSAAQLKTERRGLMNQVLPLVGDAEECFILPYVKPPIYVSKSVAIVGSSRKLREDKFGDEIDAHANVIRFKYAPIGGECAEFCGHRDNIRITLPSSFSGRRYGYHPLGIVRDYKIYSKLRATKIILCGFEQHYKLTEDKLTEHLRRNGKDYSVDASNQIFCLPWEYQMFNAILEDDGLAIGKLRSKPQLGLGSVLLFCDLGICPDVYGFDIEPSDYNYYYYWEELVKKTALSASHYHQDEYRVIRELISSGKIRYRQSMENNTEMLREIREVDKNIDRVALDERIRRDMRENMTAAEIYEEERHQKRLDGEKAKRQEKKKQAKAIAVAVATTGIIPEIAREKMVDIVATPDDARIAEELRIKKKLEKRARKIAQREMQIVREQKQQEKHKCKTCPGAK